MHFIPGMELKASEEAEILGIDEAEMGEFAYDYVGIDTELGVKGDLMGPEGTVGGSREPDHAMLHHHGDDKTAQSDTSEPEKRAEIA